ncbi:unnamed protein product, partial [Mesorhabditis belari]|uniref:Uncharacterized protein n=1 Tax=Mesorhabditis belari TaxID=2138241 RepID=A0AAF3FA27_9BILA
MRALLVLTICLVVVLAHKKAGKHNHGKSSESKSSESHSHSKLTEKQAFEVGMNLGIYSKSRIYDFAYDLSCRLASRRRRR